MAWQFEPPYEAGCSPFARRSAKKSPISQRPSIFSAIYGVIDMKKEADGVLIDFWC